MCGNAALCSTRLAVYLAGEHRIDGAPADYVDGNWLRDSPLTQDALISNMEYVLAHAGSGSNARS